MGGCFVLLVLLFSILGTAGAFPTLYRARNFTRTVPGSYYGADVEYAFLPNERSPVPTPSRSRKLTRASPSFGLQVSAGVHWCVVRVLSRALRSLLCSLSLSLSPDTSTLVSSPVGILNRVLQVSPGVGQFSAVFELLMEWWALVPRPARARSSRALTLSLAHFARSPGRT